MTYDPLSRLRAAALVLPEAEERGDDGGATFVVAGEPFARLAGGMLTVRQGPAGDMVDLRLDGDTDWASVEDRIAASWELAAPRRLLEAGGR